LSLPEQAIQAGKNGAGITYRCSHMKQGMVLIWTGAYQGEQKKAKDALLRIDERILV
jgi:hypothetical protein